jgi:hypothetical protein
VLGRCVRVHEEKACCLPNAEFMLDKHMVGKGLELDQIVAVFETAPKSTVVLCVRVILRRKQWSKNWEEKGAGGRGEELLSTLRVCPAESSPLRPRNEAPRVKIPLNIARQPPAFLAESNVYKTNKWSSFRICTCMPSW